MTFSVTASNVRHWRAAAQRSRCKLGSQPTSDQPPLVFRVLRRCSAKSPDPFLSAAGLYVWSESVRQFSTATRKVMRVYRSELVQAGELARRLPAAIDSSDVRSALEIFTDLPVLMLSPEQLSAVAQQLLRVLMSYQKWMLPTVLRDDLPGGPALWYVGVPAPGAQPGGAQLLPLTSGDEAYQSLVGAGIRGAGNDGSMNPVMIKSIVSGAQTVAQYLPADGSPSRLEGIVINVGQYDELVLGRDQLPQLRTWEATLRMEALLASVVNEGADTHDPASAELALLLAHKIRFFFVRTPDRTDLARDSAGHNLILLTSLDAAALCANAYGRDQLREVTPSELLDMASNAEGEFGYALTLGPDRRPYKADGEDKHLPMWHTRNVTTDWLAAALRRGGAGQTPS